MTILDLLRMNSYNGKESHLVLNRDEAENIFFALKNIETNIKESYSFERIETDDKGLHCSASDQVLILLYALIEACDNYMSICDRTDINPENKGESND